MPRRREASIWPASDSRPDFRLATKPRRPVPVAGQESESEKVLRDGAGAAPSDAGLRHALGLSLVRQRRVQEAVAELRARRGRRSRQPAIRLRVRGRGRFHRPPGRGRRADAGRALERHPSDVDLLSGLASYAAEAGRVEEERRSTRIASSLRCRTIRRSCSSEISSGGRSRHCDRAALHRPSSSRGSWRSGQAMHHSGALASAGHPRPINVEANRSRRFVASAGC